MRNTWLSIEMIVLAVTACAHAPVQTGVAPSNVNLDTVRPATDQPTALYVVDGVIINDQDLAPAKPYAEPLYMIDGVPLGSLRP
jgi:hypothetical protein